MYAMHKKKESNRNSPMNCWTVFLVVKAAYTISEAVWYSGMFVGFGCFLLMWVFADDITPDQHASQGIHLENMISGSQLYTLQG